MKFSKSMLFSVCTYFCTPVFAEPNPEAIKASFAPILKMAESYWEKADTLRYEVPLRGREISKAECEEIKSRIANNYAIYPFKFEYATGGMQSPFCIEPIKYYFANVEGKTELDVSYSHIIQIEHPLWGQTETCVVEHYYLNSNFKIVKVQTPRGNANCLYPTRYPPENYEIYEEDSEGNIFTKKFVPNQYSDDGKEILGSWTARGVLLADGTTPHGLNKIEKKNPQKPEMNKSFIFLSRADEKNWDAFHMPSLNYGYMTHGFYQYGNEYYDARIFLNSFLTVTYHQDKEFCYILIIHDGTEKGYIFPSIGKDYSMCANDR